ncbi:PfkB family carbohydrate kinase, partial [Klebsiella pneumoniae]|nr:PfkB family carbohydrate kinase [Klebsiella pneumoniae]
FFGAVGKDKYSEILKCKANEEGVNDRYQYTSEKPTVTCAVIVTNNGKDRSLCANLSAAQTFTEDHLNVPENKAIIENATFYLVTG